jgi:hypothetical protein
MTWGIESNVIERFVAAGVPADQITFERDTFRFDASKSPADYVADFKNFYGPTMNAFDAAEANGKTAELQKELEQLFEAKNEGENGTTSIPATYLRVTVTK